MRHVLVIVVVIYVAVISKAEAQNRGSVRYVPPENYDGGDSTRAPRTGSTRAAVVNRRQRTTTKAPETNATSVDERTKPAETPARTSGRRVPQRGSIRQIAPPPPPPTPVIEPSALYPVPETEASEKPTTEPQERQPGTRRRRPKKRRKPQAVLPKVEDEPKKPELISELINDDKKRTDEFSNNPQLRNSLGNLDSELNPSPEITNIPAERVQQNTAGPQYFRPQPSTNRLPIDDSKHGGYLDPSIVNPNIDAENEYIRKEHSTSSLNEGNYVPVLLSHPSDGGSRLPPQNYPVTRNREYVGETLPSDKYIPFGLQDNNYGSQISNAVSEIKPSSEVIYQPDDPTASVRGNSENRLPVAEQPFLSPEYELPGNSPAQKERKLTEVIERQPKTDNRLPNTPDVQYDSTYSDFTSGSQRVAGRRQETVDTSVRRSTAPYTPSRREIPTDSDNDAQYDRRSQTSQYRPPIQRTQSRYNPNDPNSDTSTQVAQPQVPAPVSPPRARGSSRYQSTTGERIRVPTESTNGNVPSRSRSTSSSRSSTIRGRQVVPVVEETSTPPPRSTSRRQPVTVSPPRKVEYAPEPIVYEEVEENNDYDGTPANRREIPNQSAAGLRAQADEEQEYGSIRNTLRSRPQYEVSDTEPPYEESVENTNTYNNEYQLPRQSPPAAGRTNQIIPIPHQPAFSQPQYHQPSHRQQNRPDSQHDAHQPQFQQPTYRQVRPEPQYEAPQNSRSRQQPQYQQPQNPRQSNPRQNAVVARQQVKPRQQEPEAPTARSRPSASKFACPEAYGYYADPVQCDKYYECRNGTAEINLCNDGLAFNEISAPKFLRCDSLRDVDCKSRPELQDPKPTKNCPRQFGLYAHETDCTKFWNCVDGTATEVQCPPGLIYNGNLGTCDWADLVENSCKSEDLLGFTCPEATAYDLQDGVYSSYPHPDNCQLHYICIKGADGLRRPRLLTCNEGTVFNPSTATCTRPDDVAGCEDFYGPRSPPKRRPAPREPEPEEELIEEEPTPRPRRRGTNRSRSRN